MRVVRRYLRGAAAVVVLLLLCVFARSLEKSTSLDGPSLSSRDHLERSPSAPRRGTSSAAPERTGATSATIDGDAPGPFEIRVLLLEADGRAAGGARLSIAQDSEVQRGVTDAAGVFTAAIRRRPLASIQIDHVGVRCVVDEDADLPVLSTDPKSDHVDWEFRLPATVDAVFRAVDSGGAPVSRAPFYIVTTTRKGRRIATDLSRTGADGVGTLAVPRRQSYEISFLPRLGFESEASRSVGEWLKAACRMEEIRLVGRTERAAVAIFAAAPEDRYPEVASRTVAAGPDGQCDGGIVVYRPPGILRLRFQDAATGAFVEGLRSSVASENTRIELLGRPFDSLTSEFVIAPGAHDFFVECEAPHLPVSPRLTVTVETGQVTDCTVAIRASDGRLNECLHLTVVNEEGAAISGAEATLGTLRGGSDEYGRIELSAERIDRVGLMVRHPAFRSRVFEALPESADVSVRVVLERQAAIEVRVEEPDGVPAQRIDVSVFREKRPSDVAGQAVIEMLLSDFRPAASEGRFRIPVPEDGAFFPLVIALRSTRGVEAVRFARRPDAGATTIRLRRLASKAIRLIDEDGRPVTDVRVTSTFEAWPTFEPRTRSGPQMFRVDHGSTDTDGAVDLRCPEIGTRLVAGFRNGGVSQVVRLLDSANEVLVRFGSNERQVPIRRAADGSSARIAWFLRSEDPMICIGRSGFLEPDAEFLRIVPPSEGPFVIDMRLPSGRRTWRVRNSRDREQLVLDL